MVTLKSCRLTHRHTGFYFYCWLDPFAQTSHTFHWRLSATRATCQTSMKDSTPDSCKYSTHWRGVTFTCTVQSVLHIHLFFSQVCSGPWRDAPDGHDRRPDRRYARSRSRNCQKRDSVRSEVCHRPGRGPGGVDGPVLPGTADLVVLICSNKTQQTYKQKKTQHTTCMIQKTKT